MDLASVSPSILLCHTHSPSASSVPGPEPGSASDTPVTNGSPAPGARCAAGKTDLGFQPVRDPERAGLGQEAGGAWGCVGVRGWCVTEEPNPA